MLCVVSCFCTILYTRKLRPGQTRAIVFDVGEVWEVRGNVSFYSLTLGLSLHIRFMSIDNNENLDFSLPNKNNRSSLLEVHRSI